MFSGWVCSVARDRYFQFHSCKNGQRLGGYLCAAWCTALSYDEGAKYAFIGDYSGQITVCQLSETGVKLINVLKGIQLLFAHQIQSPLSFAFDYVLGSCC